MMSVTMSTNIGTLHEPVRDTKTDAESRVRNMYFIAIIEKCVALKLHDITGYLLAKRLTCGALLCQLSGSKSF